tara:strand:- start:59 stop:238 length:180 start_codon:yes stop_codon:yes gene_type:complete
MTGLTIEELKCLVDILESSIEISSWDCLGVSDFEDVELMQSYVLRASALSKLNVIIGKE